MALKADLRQFLDDEGNVAELTDQAKTVLRFLTKIVLSVSENIEQRLIDVDLQCKTRADEVSCSGSIEASCFEVGNIEWHCDTCEASGTISNWQGSVWDKQKRILH
jgi:phage host-nuclease inhibitor protein Gam